MCHMRNSANILRQEWRRLYRDGILSTAVIMYCIAATVALFNGHAAVNKRMAATDILQQRYSGQIQALRDQLHADTSSPSGKAAYISATIPMVADYKLHATASFPPGGLAALSIGMSDLARNQYPVAIKSNYVPAEERISNPLQLLSGSFDAAFLIIYLAPLVVICATYNVLSADKEQGMLSLLMVQGGNIIRILLIRMLLSYLLIMTGIILLTVPSLLMSHPPSRQEWLKWTGICSAWTALWMSIMWLIISRNRGNAENLLLALATWLLLLIVLPSAGRLYINNSITDDTAAHASVQREIEWTTWDIPRLQLLDSFYLQYPQYKNAKAYDTTLASNRSAMAYFSLVDQRMERFTASVEQHRLNETKAIQASVFFNPAAYTQMLLNSIARTDVADYERFRTEIYNFRRRWKDFFHEMEFNDRRLTEDTYCQLPSFRMKDDFRNRAKWQGGMRYLLGLTTICITAGSWILRKNF